MSSLRRGDRSAAVTEIRIALAALGMLDDPDDAHLDLPQGLLSRPVEGAALAHEINLTTKRGRLYSPPVKAFVDLALKPRRPPQPVASAA